MASDAVTAQATPGRWISEGWRIVSSDLGSFVLMTAIALALTFVGNFVVAGPLACGLFIAVRRRMQESRTEIADVFSGFSLFIDAFLICIISGAFLLIGLALLFFPVFIAAALYLFPYLFLVDRKLSFWDALEASRKMALRNLPGYLLFVIALALLNFAGLLMFGVGILLTIPVTVAAIAAAYEDTVGFQSKPPTGPVLIT
jgi:uncharacterized membrane protein